MSAPQTATKAGRAKVELESSERHLEDGGPLVVADELGVLAARLLRALGEGLFRLGVALEPEPGEH